MPPRSKKKVEEVEEVADKVDKVVDNVEEVVEKVEEVADKVEEVVDKVEKVDEDIVKKVEEVPDKVKEVVDKVEPVVPNEEAPKFEGTFYFDSWGEKIFVLQSFSYQKYISNFENHITVSNFFPRFPSQ